MSLTEARAVIRRAAPPNRGDQAYRLYLAVLAFCIYVGPMAAAGSRALAPDDAWSRLQAPSALAGIAAAIELALLLAVRLGSTLGPVRPAAGYVSFVLTSAVDRARALRGAWLLTVGVLGATSLLLGADVVAARAVAGRWSWAWVLPAVTAGAAGVSLAGVWLRGQTRCGRGLLTVVLLLTLAVGIGGTLLTGTPWRVAMLLAGPGGWWALASADPSSGWGAAATVLAVVTAAIAARVGPQLRRLTVHELAGQAARVSGVSAGVVRGNLLDASSALAGTGRRGRALRLGDAPSGPPIARRDLLGLRRTRETSLAGIVLVASGAALAGLSIAHSWPLLPVALAAGLTALGVNLLSGGLHAHATTANRDSWLGVPFRAAAVQHAWTPYAVSVAVWWLVTAVLSPLGAGPSFTWGPLVLAIVVVAEVAASHRGDLPPGVTGTVSAEYGDTGAIQRALWIVGMPLLATAAGGGVIGQAEHPLTAAVAGVIGVAVAAMFAANVLERATAR